MAVERAMKRRRLSPPEDGRSAIPGFAKWNLEQAYEQKPRKNKKKEETTRLPIKRGGKIEQVEAPEIVVPEEEDPEDEDSNDADENDSAVADLHVKPAVKKPKLSHKEEVRQAKEELARIAGSISENPEENIASLKLLAEFAASENVTVKKLALGTQLAVFKDIIPGYRIRQLSKDDANARVSKEVRNLRNFEQSLLSGYHEYVQLLSKLATKDGGEDLSAVAMFCACALLESVSHFNFRNDIIGILVRKLGARRVDADFVKAREAVERLFREDEQGHASLEVVNQLTKMMKGRDYGMHESVLNTFLHLRLLSEFVHKASTNSVDKDDQQQQGKKSRQKKEFRTKRERKVMRERKEVEKEMREADTVVSYEERDKNQAEMLKLVFVTYFRILKARTQHLMGAVLEGLAKYAHLINQDFFGDVLEALKDLINDAEASLRHDVDENETNGEAGDDSEEDDPELNAASQRDAIRESLLCIITAFALLQGQQDVAKSANSLHLDLKFFITHLYRTILPLSQEADIELSAKTAHLADPNGLDVPVARDTKVNVATTTVLLLRSLQAVLLPATATKSVPPVRIAAFVKLLLTAALHLPLKSSEALVALLGQVSKTHGPRIAALWHTEERRGDGVFDALSAEVESSNPFAATVWEGELLRLHYDPKVREGVKAMEKNVVSAR